MHHNNYFGASWGARSGGGGGAGSGSGSGSGGVGGATSFDIVGVGAAGGGAHAQFAHVRQQLQQQPQPQPQGFMGQTGDSGDAGGEGGGGGGAGSRDGLFKKTRNIMSLGDLRGAAAEEEVAASAPTEGSKKSARQKKEREDSAGALAALLASSGHGSVGSIASNTADAGAPAAAAHNSTAEPMEPDSPSGESAGRSGIGIGAGAGGAAASPASNSGGALPGGGAGASTNSPHYLRDALEQQMRQHEAQGLGKRAPPRLPSGEAVGGMAGMRRPPADVGGAGAGAGVGAGGAGVGLAGIGAKSTSALDKLVHEQDRGQAVRSEGERRGGRAASSGVAWQKWIRVASWTMSAVVLSARKCISRVVAWASHHAFVCSRNAQQIGSWIFSRESPGPPTSASFSYAWCRLGVIQHGVSLLPLTSS